MFNGEVSQVGGGNTDVRIAIIDGDLIKERKNKIIFNRRVFTELNAKVVSYIRQNRFGIDQFEICDVGLSKRLFKAIEDLQLGVLVKVFPTEDEYKNYLVSREAYVHFATKKRKYYTRRSIEITLNSF